MSRRISVEDAEGHELELELAVLSDHGVDGVVPPGIG